MVTESLGSALKVGEINVGLAGGEPNSSAPFIAMGLMTLTVLKNYKALLIKMLQKTWVIYQTSLIAI